MSTKKDAPVKAAAIKESPKDIVISQLRASLPTLKELLSVKKFDKRIAKAAKLLTAGIKKKPGKKKIASKKTAVTKKSSKQAAAKA